MSKLRSKIPKLLTYEEFTSSNIEELGLPTSKRWADVLGDKWEYKSDKENYDDYVSWYQSSFTLLGKLLGGKHG
jgi:hypothetical protein